MDFGRMVSFISTHCAMDQWIYWHNFDNCCLLYALNNLNLFFSFCCWWNIAESVNFKSLRRFWLWSRKKSSTSTNFDGVKLTRGYPSVWRVDLSFYKWDSGIHCKFNYLVERIENTSAKKIIQIIHHEISQYILHWMYGHRC